MQTWKKTWKGISRLPALKELRVTLVWQNSRPWRPRARDEEKERGFLEPLRGLGTLNLELFVVKVNWDGERIEDMPFKFVRGRI
jgi:hypothetical protein